MPMQSAPLSPAELAEIRSWIGQGAPWSNAPAAGSGKAPLWSLQPLRKPQVPQSASRRVRNPIDAFVAAKLAEKKLTPSAEADAVTLIRRLTYDLHGLPPTWEEIQSFAADHSPEAYEKLVDRLLASPRYGERWGRHWLDVAHYGESHGYDKDKPRRNAWPYRDYVIARSTSDKPYDRFVQRATRGRRAVAGRTGGADRHRIHRRRTVGFRRPCGTARRHHRQGDHAAAGSRRHGHDTVSAFVSMTAIARAATTTSSTRSRRRTTTACRPSSPAWTAPTGRTIRIRESTRRAACCWKSAGQ